MEYPPRHKPKEDISQQIVGGDTPVTRTDLAEFAQLIINATSCRGIDVRELFIKRGWLEQEE